MKPLRTQSAPGMIGGLGEEIGGRLAWPPILRSGGVLAAGYASVVLVLGAIGWLITYVAISAPLRRWDRSSTAWLADRRSPWMDDASQVLSRSADTMSVIGLAVFLALVLAWRHRWREIGVLVAALALELGVFLLVNHSVGRPRPDVERLGSTPSTSSLPSGHTAATVVVYGSIALFVWLDAHRKVLRILARIVAVVVPAAVGFARVYRGMHHPIDVLLGYGMGVAVILVALIAVSAGFGAPAAIDDEVQTPVKPSELAADGDRGAVLAGST